MSPSQENIPLVLVNLVIRSILYQIGGLRERSYEPQRGYSRFRFQLTGMIVGFFWVLNSRFEDFFGVGKFWQVFLGVTWFSREFLEVFKTIFRS